MKEKLGVIARINENVSKVKISKSMKNTHEKLFLLEELFTNIFGYDNNSSILIKNIFYNLLQMLGDTKYSFI